MKIDDINIEIIKHLRDGRKSFKKIAKILGITENTVRSRVNKLTNEGILEITGLVNPETILDHRVVFVGVKLSTFKLVDKGKEMAKGKESISIFSYFSSGTPFLSKKQNYSFLYAKKYQTSAKMSNKLRIIRCFSF